MADGIYVWIVASHSDRPINNRIYRSEEMMRQVKTWTKPYKKPVLRHHDQTDDAIGRVVQQTYVDKSRWNTAIHELGVGDEVPFPDDQTGQLVIKQHITDPDAVQKIKDGRYNTVSVGFSAEHMYCSICGTDWFEEQCQHEQGKEYDGVVQYGIPTGIIYNEVSFVNVPADDHAIVAKQINSDGESVIISNTSFRYMYVDCQKTVSQVTESNANSAVHSNQHDQEVKSMADETKEKEYEALVNQYKELQEKYDSMINSVKASIVDAIIDAKQQLGHEYSDEQKQSLREKYQAMSLDVLNAIYDELTDECEFIGKFISDSAAQTEQNSNCDCKQEQTQQTNPEPIQDKEPDPKVAENPVGFINKVGEVKETQLDQLQYVKRILRIGGDIK